MRIEFDKAKDESNQIKHGISLSRAAEISLEQSVVWEDRRFDYGERRFAASAFLDGRLHILTFTTRGDVTRVISLRKANSRERRQHANP